jgi:hypothetical protein
VLKKASFFCIISLWKDANPGIAEVEDAKNKVDHATRQKKKTIE